MDDMTPLQGDIYRYVKRLARDGLPYPGDHTAAEAIGHGHASSVQNAMYALVRKELIKLQVVGRGRFRVITVLSTGERTANPQGEIRPRVQSQETHGAVPCGWCGCRPDACGCRGGPK